MVIGTRAIACGLFTAWRAFLHRDGAEVLRRRAVDVLVTPAPHREPLRRHEVAVRRGELSLARCQHAVHRLAVAGARTQAAVDDDHLGLAGDDGRRRPRDHGRDRVASAHHALAPAEVVDADRVRDLHRRRRVAGRVAREPVDVARSEPAVAQRITQRPRWPSPAWCGPTSSRTACARSRRSLHRSARLVPSFSPFVMLSCGVRPIAESP